MTRRLAAVVLASYPLAYRRRYGEELAALVDDSPVNGRVVLDLLRGAVVAHLRPVAGEHDWRARLLGGLRGGWVRVRGDHR
jgi:hypothetical protein